MQSKTLQKILDSHPLAVLMVIEGLNRYSSQVAGSIPADYPERSIVNPEEWIKLGESIQAQLKK